MSWEQLAEKTPCLENSWLIKHPTKQLAGEGEGRGYLMFWERMIEKTSCLGNTAEKTSCLGNS